MIEALGIGIGLGFVFSLGYGAGAFWAMKHAMKRMDAFMKEVRQ